MGVRLRAAERREQLLDVAREVFAEKGFHATSMDDVARAAGVTKPVLYQHFASKRALYVELLETLGARLVEEIAAVTREAPTGREQVEAGFAAYFRFVDRNRAAFRLLFGASVRNDAEFSQILEQVVAAVADAISTLIDVAVPEEQRIMLAHAVVGMAEAVSRRALTDLDVDAEASAAWLTEMAWYGLRGIRPHD